jgi:heat shock protein HslJ
MNKTYVWTAVIAVIIVLVGFGLYGRSIRNDDIKAGNKQGIDPKNATYTVEGTQVTLVNGVSTVAIPDSSAQVQTRYFGNAVDVDFNTDGRMDTAFIISQTTGGSGVFYYVVGALNTPDGFVGSDAVLLGDRIAPQTTGVVKDKIVAVNYVDRNPGESFVVRPSLGKSRWLLLDTATMKWGEVAVNFEGESDPNKMTLGMKKWVWVGTQYNNDTFITPKKAGIFTLTFKDGKSFSVTTDCNGIGGEYVVSGSKIEFKNMVSTLMYCEGSQESVFSKMLSETQSFALTSTGGLVLILKLDNSTAIFR